MSEYLNTIDRQAANIQRLEEEVVSLERRLAAAEKRCRELVDICNRVYCEVISLDGALSRETHRRLGDLAAGEVKE